MMMSARTACGVTVTVMVMVVVIAAVTSFAVPRRAITGETGLVEQGAQLGFARSIHMLTPHVLW